MILVLALFKVFVDLSSGPVYDLISLVGIIYRYKDFDFKKAASSHGYKLG
jgi:hypothetical protein